MTTAVSLTPTPAADRGALLALEIAGLVAVAPHALELPFWVVLVFAASCLWRYVIETGRGTRPGRILRYTLAALVLAAVFREYHSLLGRDPGLALLIALLGLKLLELETRRDYMLSVFLFYLVTLGSLLYAQTLPISAYALVSVFASTAALIRLNQPTGLARRQTLGLAATLLAQAVPLMLVLYVFFPRIQGALWAMPPGGGAARTGMPESMAPGNVRNLTESAEIAFRATFEDAPPPMRDLYWRALALYVTDGQEWFRGRWSRSGAESYTALSEPLRYEIVLEPTFKHWLPALDLPTEAPRGAQFQSGFTLTHAEPVRDRRRYTLSSHTRYRTAGPTAGERAGALQLPTNLSPRVRALASEWRARGDPAAIVQAGLDYFHSENFVYTLSPPLLGADPVDEFLFETRRGFCEHYAAAYATLMRAAGVPARVVLGYQGGEYNAAGNYFIVRQYDAHAWTDVWLPERGWVRVDPTAAVAPERVELGLEAVRRLQARGAALGTLPAADALRAIEPGWAESLWFRSQLYWDLANITWYRWVADFDKERQARLFARLGLDRLPGSGPLIAILSGAAGLILVYGGLLLWRERPRLDPTQALYLKFCRRLARAGVARTPHEGPLDFAGRSARRRPDLRARIDIITRRYVRLRYGPAPEKAELGLFRHEVRSFRPSRKGP